MSMLVMAFMLFISGCTSAPPAIVDSSFVEPLKKFTSTAYGFSFSYPSDWAENTRDLPDRWAIIEKSQNPENIMLFIVSPQTNESLLVAGRMQALRDLHPDGEFANLTGAQALSIINTVQLQQFSESMWYTYGVKFDQKNVESIVSGTFCNGKEIIIVVVSDTVSFEQNKQEYIALLSSFHC